MKKIIFYLLGVILFFSWYGIFCYTLNNPFRFDVLTLWVLMLGCSVSLTIASS